MSREIDARSSAGLDVAGRAALGPIPRAVDLLTALLRLVRIEYCALGAVGVLLGAYLTTEAAPSTRVLWTAAAVFFVAAGCYAFDDVSDYTSDKANRRVDRPLVTGALSPRAARVAGSIAFLLTAAAILGAGATAGLLICLGAAVAIVYNGLAAKRSLPEERAVCRGFSHSSRCRLAGRGRPTRATVPLLRWTHFRGGPRFRDDDRRGRCGR